MRRTGILLFLLLSLSAQAKTFSMLELSVMGGYSSLGYPVSASLYPGLNFQPMGSYSWDALLGYGFFFCPYVGLGLGVDAARYGSLVSFEGSIVSTGMADSENETYDRQTIILNGKDQQCITMLEVPVTLYGRLPVATERTWISLALGAKVGTPIAHDAAYQCETHEKAYYPQWNLVLENMPQHELGHEYVRQTYVMRPITGYAAFLKIGCETALDQQQHFFFYAHILGSYYFTNTLDAPITLTTQMHPWNVGAEIGVRFRVVHTSTRHCMCADYAR